MSYRKITGRAMAMAAAALLTAACVSCQGRRMSNMEPTGDTVEVSFSQPDSQAADSVADVAVNAPDTI